MIGPTSLRTLSRVPHDERLRTLGIGGFVLMLALGCMTPPEPQPPPPPPASEQAESEATPRQSKSAAATASGGETSAEQGGAEAASDETDPGAGEKPGTEQASTGANLPPAGGEPGEAARPAGEEGTDEDVASAGEASETSGSSMTAPDGIESERGLAELQKALGESLAAYDESLERERTTQSLSGPIGGLPESEDAYVANSPGGESGSADGTTTAASAGGATGSGGVGGPRSGATTVAPGQRAGEDVVARQLRKAAEEETDPVLREKIWEEYRRYTSGRVSGSEGAGE